MNIESQLAGNLLVILIALASLVPLVALIVFVVYRMRHGSDREPPKTPARTTDRPPDDAA